MDVKMDTIQSDGAMKMTFEPVVAPGTFDDFAALEYRLSHDFDGEWMQDDPMDDIQYDAVARLQTRSQQLQLPAVQPQIPKFEGNDQWLEILLRACAPPGAAKMPDGGAAVIAKIAAAARAAGMTNPIDGMRAAIAERKRKELAAVAKAEAAQERKREEAAARRVARRNELAAAARAAGKLLPPLPRPKATAAAAGPAAAAAAAAPQPLFNAAGITGAVDGTRSSAAVSPAAPGMAHSVAAAAAVSASHSSQAQHLLTAPAATQGAATLATAHSTAVSAAEQPGLWLAQQQQQQDALSQLHASSNQLPLGDAPSPSPAAAPASKGGSKGGSGSKAGSNKRPAEEAAAGNAAAGPSNGAASTGEAAAADAADDTGAGTRAAKRQRQHDAPRSSWTLQLSFCDDVTGKPIHFKADGARFKGAKAPASLKFAFNRWYRVRITTDSSLTIRENARLTSRSPIYFEHPTDQAAATPFFQDDAIKFTKADPADAAATATTNGPSATPAAASAPGSAAASASSSAAAPAAADSKAKPPAPKKAKGAANGTPSAVPPVAAANPPAAPLTPAPPPPQEASPGRTTWEGKWRNLAEPTKKTQRAAAWLRLRCEGLGPLELPLMAKIYEYTTLHADVQDRATLQGQVMKHITFTVERNPFSELLEVSGATYTAATPAKKA